MKVLMTSTSYPLSGDDWRGRFIYSLVEAMSRRDDIELRLWCPPGDIPANVNYVASRSDARWLEHLLREGGIAHKLRQGGTSAGLTAARLLWKLHGVYRRHRDVDLVHVNWLHNAIPLIRTRTPAAISVLGTDFGLLKQRFPTALLHHVCKNRPVAVTPNADWMAPELRKKMAATARIVPIPFGVDPEWFDMERINTPDGPRRWLVVSRLTTSKLGPLFEWGRQVADTGDEIHLIGPMQETLRVPDWVHYHGSTNTEALREEWFPRAAGLVTLSTHDEGRPQVMIEAQAAGLPVIASRLPAHTDLVTHGNTGYLVATEQEFMDSIVKLRDFDHNRTIGTNARDWIQTEIGTWDDCAQRYMNVYHSLLDPAYRQP